MPNDADPVVHVEALTKRFGRNTVLEDIRLDVHAGEVVAVIGPSGAGKSTFLRCINYLQPFERGTVRVLGQELHGTEEPGFQRPAQQTLTAIRTRVGMVFQTFNLFPHLTVLENILLGPMETRGVPRGQAEAAAHALLQRVGLKDKSEAYPRRLSGGQQQRVAICRALAMQPEIMLFDEPTSMLDPELVGEVLAVIRELADDGMTMLLATHEMSFARDVADTVVVMADRRIVETGPARQVLTEPRTRRTRVFLRRVLEHVAVDDDSDTDADPGDTAAADPTAPADAPDRKPAAEQPTADPSPVGPQRNHAAPASQAVGAPTTTAKPPVARQSPAPGAAQTRATAPDHSGSVATAPPTGHRRAGQARSQPQAQPQTPPQPFTAAPPATAPGRDVP